MKQIISLAKTTFTAAAFLIALPIAASAAGLPAPAVSSPDALAHLLCPDAAAPEAAPDKRLIKCALEYGEFAPAKTAGSQQPPAALKVVAYNMERGLKLDEQIKFFKENPDFNDADVLLLGEVDRGCSRTGSRNVARDLARALGMDYLYVVEFVELPRRTSDIDANVEATCEHGNALMSRYKILGAEQIRFKESNSWYGIKDQPRLGGRIAIAADIDVNDKKIRFYSAHLESAMEVHEMRAAEVKELIEHAGATAGGTPVIMGGDFNTHLYIKGLKSENPSDPTPRLLIKSGYTDAHSSIPAKKRGTTRSDFGMRLVIDLIFSKGIDAVESGICPGKVCDPLSDHLPIWAKFDLK